MNEKYFPLLCTNLFIVSLIQVTSSEMHNNRSIVFFEVIFTNKTKIHKSTNGKFPQLLIFYFNPI
jgi:hypothetical protein